MLVAREREAWVRRRGRHRRRGEISHTEKLHKLQNRPEELGDKRLGETFMSA